MENNLLSVSKQSEVEALDSVYAKMVLDKALRDFRKKQIQKEIDQSLQDRNKEEFLRLTAELKDIS
ncbi:IDEAL domain-containing protein [Ectobacillus funiculus]|uniref:IDEAL domain-containing protein n=1 Tax=Ectobacillus funiculus TaxID=137993 RepID=A0ABV5WHJ7_9BACI